MLFFYCVICPARIFTFSVVLGLIFTRGYSSLHFQLLYQELLCSAEVVTRIRSPGER